MSAELNRTAHPPVSPGVSGSDQLAVRTTLQTLARKAHDDLWGRLVDSRYVHLCNGFLLPSDRHRGPGATPSARIADHGVSSRLGQAPADLVVVADDLNWSSEKALTPGRRGSRKEDFGAGEGDCGRH